MKCFYHNDMDGKCAGSIVARVTGNYNAKDYIMYNYDGEIPTELIEDGETVYFVDLSFSVNTVDKLKEIVKTKHCDLIWCDHHSSSMDILAKYPEFSSIKGIRKEGISGAGLTWMYLMGCDFDDIPLFVKYVSDFDCWQFKYEESLFFKYALESMDYDALDIIWNKLVKDSNSKDNPLLAEMVHNGTVISKYVEKEYEAYRNAYAYESRIDGIKCLVVNRSCNSLVFGEVIKDYPIVAIWAFNGEKYKYSIYSEKPDVDCSKIAERYGGGGHKGASGFVSNKMILNKAN